MMETGSEQGSDGWNGFIKEHWLMFLLIVAGGLLLALGAILVFLWFVGEAQTTGLVPSTLGLWTMGHLVTFLLNLLFWEILLIGVPALVAVGAFWLWWKRLPAEQRNRYRLFRSRSRSSNGGNAVSLVVFIAFLIKVYLDGNWDVPFATWTFDYLVYSWITALAWLLAIAAIPAVIVLIWWVTRGRKSGKVS